MAAHKLQGRMKLYGLDISIENAKGSKRTWYDPHGKQKGSTLMHADYGYIRQTIGTDGDHVDVYVGSHPDAAEIYCVKQMKKPPESKPGDGLKWTQYDEDKCMLAFPSAEAAKALYLKQYDDPRFFGGMKTMSVEAFKARVLDPENYGKKVAQLLVELNLSRLAQNEPVVMPQHLKLANGDILGVHSPGLSTLPAVTTYSGASMSRQEKKRGDDAVKKAAEGRVGRIADRIDDAGIGLLAAPYVAGAAGGALSRATNPKLKAVGGVLKKFGPDSAFGHSHAREIAGLAMVAPGVTHQVAKGVNKVMPGKKQALEKVAASLWPDFEYMTETEKTAIIAALGRLGARSAKAITTGGQAVGKALTQGGTAVKGLATAEQAASKALHVPTTTRVPAPTLRPPPAVTSGGVPAAVGSTAATPSKWNPLSGKNLAMGGVAALGATGAYAGYKGIQGVSTALKHQHDAPLAAPGFTGAGRVF